jgi:DNA polymerase-1
VSVVAEGTAKAMTTAGHLLVIDGDNLVHRLFHGSTGPPAEAFGFAIGRYRRRLAPTHAVIVWDPTDDGPRWRRDLWPSYKGDRPEHPAALALLFLEARDECRGWRLTQASTDGIEADDLIAAYTEAGAAAGMAVTIVSGDKDLVQLVRDEPAVRMQDDIRKRVWGPAECVGRFGVSPALLPDLLALIGDVSDCYPGVPGIGPATAVPLLLEYGSLEGVLANAPLVRSTAVMKRLLAHRDQARVCGQLARLRSDVALPVPLAATRWTP